MAFETEGFAAGSAIGLPERAFEAGWPFDVLAINLGDGFAFTLGDDFAFDVPAVTLDDAFDFGLAATALGDGLALWSAIVFEDAFAFDLLATALDEAFAFGLPAIVLGGALVLGWPVNACEDASVLACSGSAKAAVVRESAAKTPRTAHHLIISSSPKN